MLPIYQEHKFPEVGKFLQENSLANFKKIIWGAIEDMVPAGDHDSKHLSQFLHVHKAFNNITSFS